MGACVRQPGSSSAPGQQSATAAPAPAPAPPPLPPPLPGAASAGAGRAHAGAAAGGGPGPPRYRVLGAFLKTTVFVLRWCSWTGAACDRLGLAGLRGVEEAVVRGMLRAVQGVGGIGQGLVAPVTGAGRRRPGKGGMADAEYFEDMDEDDEMLQQALEMSLVRGASWSRWG